MKSISRLLWGLLFVLLLGAVSVFPGLLAYAEQLSNSPAPDLYDYE